MCYFALDVNPEVLILHNRYLGKRQPCEVPPFFFYIEKQKTNLLQNIRKNKKNT